MNSTTALYKVVWVAFVKDSVFEVFETGDQVAPPFVDASHLTTFPVFPVKVNVPLFEPVQTVVMSGEIVPPSGGFTVTVTSAVFVHPLASVPVTVYVVVTVGEAVTVAPLVGAKPVVGLQV